MQVGNNPGWIARNHPFRGFKTLIWEGGTRVAGFVHSDLLPASVKGTISNSLFHVTDWLPTIVAMAGGNTARNLPLDGHNQWPTLMGKSVDARTEMLYGLNPAGIGQAGPPKAGLRMGDYKVQLRIPVHAGSTVHTRAPRGLCEPTYPLPCTPPSGFVLVVLDRGNFGRERDGPMLAMPWRQ
jgi:arylsulfatase A-like enzyme